MSFISIFWWFDVLKPCWSRRDCLPRASSSRWEIASPGVCFSNANQPLSNYPRAGYQVTRNRSLPRAHWTYLNSLGCLPWLACFFPWKPQKRLLSKLPPLPLPPGWPWYCSVYRLLFLGIHLFSSTDYLLASPYLSNNKSYILKQWPSEGNRQTILVGKI